MDEPEQRKRGLVGVVGPCCAGKSTLVKALAGRGYLVTVIAQEHSFVPRMWQVFAHADRLIYLDVSYPVAQQRRWMSWTPADLDEQHRRLQHARDHCHLYLHTDALTAAEVLAAVEVFLAAPTQGS